ncbi:ATP-dependent nuclease [Citrobacter portucalensis]|uniref:ATP-dependent nuclease n=1 Tax=Citrobacter portucalensis TaxID=1639133 RepID=UPI001C7007C0|nr:AAA family ATPase [Citrobacter portucalensis]MBW9452784.1 AAA family ATPase [Citrobacter portucalensis]MBW9456749.1 AAA family ATPase [Citrobacter portucalensis]WFZ26311.1 AAA family ATPase [Citrobacter portucalensis]
MSTSSYKDKIRSLQRALNAGQFEPFIQHIRFPYFKNIEQNARIDFQFPITALVGQNGTNKSSVIKALFGCPYGKSITRYWFTTETDEFPDLQLADGSSLKPRYIYGYKNSDGRLVEILQTRINATKHTIDYWETSRPSVGDNMESVSEVSGAESNATRWQKVKKGLVFLDFRSEISAFDRCMYHSDFKLRKKKDGKLITKQDYIRSKSKYIKKAFDEKLKNLRLWGSETIVKNVTLTPDLVQAVSYILGRNYKDIKFLEHRLWGARGGTALLSTDKLNYTEAFAGSGEFAIVSLVLSIYSAKPNSLILLDEPEVSLHPGAQKRMMEILYSIVEQKKHQVVVSTHSPVIVNLLPKEAIKLFIFDEDSETAKIAQNISPDEAFVELGHDITKKTIIVEDKLAKEIIAKAIKSDDRLKLSFNINYIPGGSETILSKHLPSYAMVSRDDILFLLDGDKNKKVKPVRISEIADANLVKTMREYYGCELVINASGSNGKANELEANALKRQALEYAFQKVQYLPFNTPEQFLIESAILPDEQNIIDSQSWDANDLDMYKKQIRLLAQHQYDKEEVDSGEIFCIQKIMIARLKDDLPEMAEIRKVITQAIERGIIK